MPETGFAPCLRTLPALAAATVLVGTASAAAQAPDIAPLCRDRKPCTLVQATPAGQDGQGRTLMVIELNLGTANPDSGGDDRFNCRPYVREFWLTMSGAAEPRRVLSLCNDGYGAAGVGEDEVAIGPNRLVHARVGGSAWRWTEEKTIQLSPLRVLSQKSCSYHNVNIGYSLSQWDWRQFAGERRWYPQYCKAGDPPEERNRPDWCDPAGATRRHALIPRLDGAMAGAVAHLGSCAASFDESGQRGYVIFGKPRSDGAEFRVLMVGERDLIVTVTDRAFAAGAKSWVHDDHIELWIGQDESGLSCNETRIRLGQWAVGLDGKVHHGTGDRLSPPVVVGRAERRIAGRQQVTLRIRLPKVEHDYLRAVTVVFSKSEDGRQARLTATSPVKRNDTTTLSSIYRIEAKGARCAARDGQLDLDEWGRIEVLEE